MNSSLDFHNIVGVHIVDEYNLEISLNRASPNMLGLLTFPFVPEHEYANLSMALQEDFTPIGTGPFKFNDAMGSKDIELIANEDYRFDKPRIEKTIGRVLENDLFMTSFEAGQIDKTMTSEVEWTKYKNNSSIDIIEFISSDYEFLGFNFDKEIF